MTHRRCALTLMVALLLSAVIPGLAGAAEPVPLSPSLKAWTSDFSMSHGLFRLGAVKYRLTPLEQEGCYLLEVAAHPSAIMGLFISQQTERSQFCLHDGELRPMFFSYINDDESRSNFTLDFDWQNRVVRSSAGELRELSEGMLDRLSMQVAVQRWARERGGEVGPERLSLTVVEAKKARPCEFQIVSQALQDVPAGHFNTVVVERVDEGAKPTRFWLAPSLDYGPVRIEQVRGSSEKLSMELLSYHQM